MSMVRNYHGAQGGSGLALSSEQCKPDWESMIKRQREELSRIDEFLESIIKFTGASVHDGKMAELIGEVYTMKRSTEAAIERMIKEQEKEG